ncbi:MAG TPA: CstA-like transporter-associated (seleno)protein [Planctomycetota bacterium]|nr:CstA-like transporter-associated (seleno)protein [Planctomycetota bacterium]
MLRRLLIVAWSRLREWSGDDAYERYLAEHRGHGHALLGRREFYRAYFDRRGKRPRCC